MTFEQVQSLINRHIENYERLIEERHAAIQESYGCGQVNVDSDRDAIKRYEERKRALIILLSEISS